MKYKDCKELANIAITHSRMQQHIIILFKYTITAGYSYVLGLCDNEDSPITIIQLCKYHDYHDNGIMYRTKRNGPSTDPWGTPLVTSNHCDSIPFRTTL